MHSFIRPAGGALIAAASIGDAPPAVQGLAALAGAGLAASTHFTKAGTRAIANTSPEPFSNWILSLSEDGFVIVLAVLALEYPLIAAIVVLAGLAIIMVLASWLIRGFGRRLRRAPQSSTPDVPAYALIALGAPTALGVRLRVFAIFTGARVLDGVSDTRTVENVRGPCSSNSILVWCSSALVTVPSPY
jgi:hypothetical protein